MSIRHKISYVQGIHAHEDFCRSLPEAEFVWQRLTEDRDVVFAALYQAGHEAPLSGTEYHLIRTHLWERARNAIKAEAYDEVAAFQKEILNGVEGRPDNGVYALVESMRKTTMRIARTLRGKK